jgi:hypothetical protein
MRPSVLPVASLDVFAAGDGGGLVQIHFVYSLDLPSSVFGVVHEERRRSMLREDCIANGG